MKVSVAIYLKRYGMTLCYEPSKTALKDISFLSKLKFQIIKQTFILPKICVYLNHSYTGVEGAQEDEVIPTASKAGVNFDITCSHPCSL